MLENKRGCLIILEDKRGCLVITEDKRASDGDPLHLCALLALVLGFA